MGKFKTIAMIATLSAIATITALLTTCTAAQKDVVITRKTEMSSMGQMIMEINSVEYVRADRYAIEMSTNLGELGEKLKNEASNPDSVPFSKITDANGTFFITRLDKGIVWLIDNSNKTYMEIPLSSLSEEISKNYKKSLRCDSTDIEIAAEIKKEDELVEIQGFQCKKVSIIITAHSKSEPKMKFETCFDCWNTNDLSKYSGMDTFNVDFTKATGLDIIEMQNIIKNACEAYGNIYDQVSKEMKGIQGYPIKIVITAKAKLPFMGDNEDMSIMSITSSTVESMTEDSVDQAKYELPEGLTVKSQESNLY